MTIKHKPLLSRQCTFLRASSIHPSFHGLSPVGVQCLSDSLFPLCTILCNPTERVYVHLAPFFDVIQPLPTWSSSPCPSLLDPKHHTLHQSLVFHPADMSKQAELHLHDELYNVPRVSNSSSHLPI